MRARTLLAALLLLLVCVAARADDEAQAREHFTRGVDLYEKKQWAPALDEFERSLALHPTRNATKNAGLCLRELGRFDEALERYDALLGTPKLPGDERAALESDGAQLRRFTGLLSVDVEPGAVVMVDGRDRGTSPLPKPIRVSIGTRAVRITKPGRSPWEARVVVASGETRAMRVVMTTTAEVGKLHVTEQGGKLLDVRVDGAVVGTTPWEGSVSVGTHAVSLSGQGDVGTEAIAVDVERDHARDVVLKALTLPGDLRIETTPTDARVELDGKPLSTGTWVGRVTSGPHVVDVSSPWHIAQQAKVEVSTHHPSVVRMALESVPRAYVDVFGGVSLLPIYSAPLVGGCVTCVGLPDVGVRGGYRLSPHLAVEAYFLNLSIQNAIAYQSANVFLSSGGLSVAYRSGDRWPFTARFMAGVARGDAETYAMFWTAVGGPEARIGYRFATNVSLDVGLGAVLFVLPAVDSQSSYQNALGGLIFHRYELGGGLGVTFPLTVGLHADL